MRAFGNYILSGRMQAIAILAIFSLLIPLLPFLLSGVAVGLITLRKGSYYAGQVIGGSLLTIFVIAFLLNFQPFILLVNLSVIWISVYICALALRHSENLAMMSLVCASVAVTFILFMYIGNGDVEASWRLALTQAFETGLAAGTTEQYQQVIEIAPPLMNALAALMIVIGLIVTLLLARWWQSALFNPQGFAKEFHTFRLPKGLILPTITGMFFLFLGDQSLAPMLRDLLAVVVVLYLFQGIASVHRTAKYRSLSRHWLIGMYCLLAAMPQIMVIFIAWIGMTDSLLGARTIDKGNDE